MDPKRNRKNSKSPTGDVMADCVLPEDIMLCIFTRLPVKSIHRFKSVCKPLREVLSSPAFAKMHRAQFPLNPENQSVIICNQTGKFDHTTISLLKIDSDLEKKPIPPSQVYYIPKPIEFVGCCNGLICLSFLDQQIALWNPALNNMSMLLPLPDLEVEDPETVSIGFGYNEEDDDFKVIIIVESKIDENLSVLVYSANSNSWSKIDLGFHFSVVMCTNNVIVNGCPYWDSWVDEKLVLVCFDVRKMVFKILPWPSRYDTEFRRYAVRGLEGRREYRVDQEMQFWIVGVECVESGWVVGGVCEEWEDCYRGSFEDGKLYVFDTENGNVVIDEVGNEWWSSYVCGDYTESLAYIKGMEKQGSVILTKTKRDPLNRFFII
ncbi:hypothetical protein CASFOL_027763 [Castilleja foliolosa]|uniref:F-box domain-containing protein n=1 Tax=Castilleja foliolosa TaxID=1961234 RepID=A0ABD3CGU4_9LAMI